MIDLEQFLYEYDDPYTAQEELEKALNALPQNDEGLESLVWFAENYDGSLEAFMVLFTTDFAKQLYLSDSKKYMQMAELAKRNFDEFKDFDFLECLMVDKELNDRSNTHD